MGRTLRTGAAALAAALAVFFLLPLTMGVCHVGMLWPAAALALLAAALLWGGRWPRWLRRALTAAYAVLFLAAAAMTVWMASAACHAPPEDETCTVIVPGCQVTADGPSVMLQRRIDAALAYLTAHPDARCVASGGMDDYETVTEADCIADALIAAGVDPGRIYREDRSGSTAENMAFSAALIRREGLSPRVAVATDGFHQLRCATFARRQKLTPWALPCASPWYLAAGYWCREMAGMAAALVRGY